MLFFQSLISFDKTKTAFYKIALMFCYFDSKYYIQMIMNTYSPIINRFFSQQIFPKFLLKISSDCFYSKIIIVLMHYKINNNKL